MLPDQHLANVRAQERLLKLRVCILCSKKVWTLNGSSCPRPVFLRPDILLLQSKTLHLLGWLHLGRIVADNLTPSSFAQNESPILLVPFGGISG